MAGRPRKRSVWNYFKHNQEKNKCVCQVKVREDDTEVMCGKELNGVFASNMKKHLKMHHKEAYQSWEQEENDRKKGESSMKRKDSVLVAQQMTLEQVLKKNSYPKDSKKQLAITKKLAIFVGATNTPLSMIDSPEFHDFLAEINGQFNIPGRKKLGDEIEKVYAELKHSISDVLHQANRISICCDIWSKQGMTASFLGVTVHCFTFNNKKRHSITLAVRRFESPHTGERTADLLRAIIDEWKIPHYKIFRSLTDNGSNIVFNLLSINEEENDETTMKMSIMMTVKINSESKTSDDEEVSVEKDLEEAVQQFEEHENDPCFNSTLNRAKKLVKKVNKSCKATEMLVKTAKRKLVSNCPTRWDSTYLMISRLLCVKDHINAVLEELGWDGLTTSQWKQLRAIEELLEPSHIKQMWQVLKTVQASA